jgi:hypothetical protein
MDGSICVIFGGNFDKAETARLTGGTVTNERHRIDGDASLREPILKLCLCCLIREVADKQFLHKVDLSRDRQPVWAIVSGFFGYGIVEDGSIAVEAQNGTGWT